MPELINAAYTFLLYALDVAPFWVTLVVGVLGYVLSILAIRHFPNKNDKTEGSSVEGAGSVIRGPLSAGLRPWLV